MAGSTAGRLVICSALAGLATFAIIYILLHFQTIQTQPLNMDHVPHLMKILVTSLFFLPISISTPNNDRKPYVIQMDTSSKPSPFSTHEKWYTSMLTSVSAESENIDTLPPTHLYTYNHAFNGFSAVLTSSQLQRLKQVPGHLTAIPDSYATLHTTHTPKFLGLNPRSGLWPSSKFGKDVIIGIIDTGVWPESESFNDRRMPPIPTKWKGKCENGTDFSPSLCNRKLIGARFFSKGLKSHGFNISRADDYESPRDFFGHGTHTSSTAAGGPVRGASYFGYAEGTMMGIAPMARVAMYKALFSSDDFKSAASDVLAAMDQAIEDGVDLMSLSLGFSQSPYYEDVIAIGAFAAMEKGIFVSVSAGNSGPRAYTVINGAPWFTSVGAGTIDRDYTAAIALTLGDTKKTIKGRSVFPENIFISNMSLYFGHGDINKESCSYLSLNQTEVAEKVVFCSKSTATNLTDQMREIARTGAKAAVIATDVGQSLDPEDFYMPYVTVTLRDGEIIEGYVTENPTPTVDIKFILTELGTRPAPQVADFSSRGPSSISPGILKPDILAPGVNVLASWVPNRGFAPLGDDYLMTDYALLSGTSMASPHVIGIAALLKSAHPNWSPAAVRSAMMTTADTTDNTGGQIRDMGIGRAASPLDFGAGHVNPNKAMDPGLVYDIVLADYMDFLCGLNYTSLQIGAITTRYGYTCTRANLDLNYPSFTVILETNYSSKVFKRVLTNVGGYPTSYQAAISEPEGMKVTVEPQVLHFEGKASKQEFSMKVEINLEDVVGGKTTDGGYIGNYGFLSWIEVGGKHVVRSPIVSAFAPTGGGKH
ncbi:subtilisin-like protease SBT1.7 [Asparagus officinalis]|uniref:subtilisin-like protease SBT1.7 n=1 Tax=Asparagus officinalis TaxID=4686 RepID=UPI00098E07AD|nr:subtilisin-like protease SBT1.7 [Asparagus officinalis]